MNTHIIDALRPEPPALDPEWEAETVRAILEGRTDPATSTSDRKGRLTRVALVAAAVVALIGGAVVARNALPSDDIRPAKPVKDKVQTIDPAKATKLKLDVVADLPRTFNGEHVNFWKFLEDDIVLGTTAPASKAEVLAQSHPVMYDLGTKTFTLLDDRERAETTQVVDVSGNETALVWAELVGTSIDTSNFAIYSYDRQSKQVTAIAEFDDPDGQIVYGNDLAIAGNTAYFSTPAYVAKAGQEAVYAVPVDGSQPPKVIAQGGVDVRISGETLTYAAGRNPKDKKTYPTFYDYDLQTGETTLASVSTHAGEPGFCGAAFTDAFETWCVGHTLDGVDPSTASTNPALLRIKETSGRTTEFAPFDVGSPNAPIPHDVIALGRWTAITVATEDGQDREFLVDLDTQEVKVFPDNTSFTALSPDRSTALISSYASKGPGPQRIVRIPD